MSNPEPEAEPESKVLYRSLVEVLSSQPVLEIEILPSSFSHPASSPLFVDGPALALCKKTLIKAFLVARGILISHLTLLHDFDTVKSLAALESTAVILLFDPNHITAANIRKRQLLASQSSDLCADSLQSSVQHELNFIESLVTSPLVRHTKSSTLWTQRLWVVRTFPRNAVDPGACDGTCIEKSHVEAFWTKETSIVMKAGERHPKNYYAWHYARRLYHLLTCDIVLFESPIGYGNNGEYLATIVLGQVHRWCLQHPRDISCWTFLIFLFDISLSKVHDSNVQHRLEMLVEETRCFARKYGWSGQSMDWVLKAMAGYGMGSTTVTQEDGAEACLASVI